ncbi:MAG: helix-turn-helix transcriptional regulator [Phycisphaerae bacterium]|nr:helix-turn-helix transcriptional regulator [Phycisphaerae bacterium]MDW8262756.1 helix-turn-helix transcriptional regulator [Phycisphaerales bacterium]
MHIPLKMDDVEAIVHLLGNVAGMEGPIVERRRALMEGVCGLIGCDAWVWVHERFDPQTGQGVFFSVLDGGFATEQDRFDYFRASMQPKLQKLYAPVFLDAVRRRLTHFTWTHEQILPDHLRDRPELAHYAREGRYEPCMWSIYMLSDTTLSGIGVLRQRDRPPTGDRERAIVHLILSQVDWLHRAGTDVPANQAGMPQLSGRQREVLFLLLGGQSRKEIARRLQLSSNTVADHMKSLYRLFAVRSKTQLLSRFIAGETQRKAVPDPPSGRPGVADEVQPGSRTDDRSSEASFG